MSRVTILQADILGKAEENVPTEDDVPDSPSSLPLAQLIKRGGFKNEF